MDTQTVEFFKQLERRGHEPLLEEVSGVACFELTDGGRIDRWLVAIDRGDMKVSHKAGRAECTIRAERALFERLCRGEDNAIAALLRGELVCTGNVGLLVAIQRLFPGPRSAVSSEEMRSP